MAVQLGGGSRGRGRYRPLAEINVTPLVDVMLVLLIIFMVTAPLIQQGVKVNLPQARAQPVQASDKKLVLSVDAQRRVYIGEAPVRLEELETKLKANARAQADKEVYLHADRDKRPPQHRVRRPKVSNRAASDVQLRFECIVHHREFVLGRLLLLWSPCTVQMEDDGARLFVSTLLEKPSL